MLIYDRTHRVWAALSLVVSVVATGVYVWYAQSSVNGPSGGSLPGLMFGIIAGGMMVFAGLLAARRRFPAARVGSAQFWMRGHLWIGTLTVPFALFHAGFGWGGRLEILLWILFLAVVLSGFWGLALQQILPRMMLEQLPRETFIEQIPYLCTRFTAESDRMLAEVCGPLEVSLTAVELKQFEPHLRPHFEKDRNKRRTDYPKTVSESAHFQIFLAKVYVGISNPVPAAVTAPAVADAIKNDATKNSGVDAGSIRHAVPVMKSVAQVTSPEAATPSPAPPSATAPLVETVPVVAAGKPDAKALLAAMKAKKAAAAEVAPVEVKPEPAPEPVKAAAPPSSVVAAAAAGKPDAKALLAAMKAKKAAAEPAPVEVKPEPAPPPVEAAAPPSAAVPASAAGKPDAKAMLALMKAKRDAAAQAATPTSSTAAAAEPTPAAELPPAAAIQQKPVKAPVAVFSTPAPSAPMPAGRVAPPSKSQVAELKQFYLELIRPQLPMQPNSHRWMEAIRRSTMACGIRQDNQHPEFIGIFDQLRDLCEQRRQFAFVQRYHRWLHGWLLVHIPASVALYFVLAVHAIMALRVIPFGN